MRLSALLSMVACQTAQPLISEVRVDCLPPFTNVEYIELTGIPGYELDGLALVIIGDADNVPGPNLGDSGVIEQVVNLNGYSVPNDHVFLIHASALLLEPPDLSAPLGLEDGDNLTVLLVRAFSGSVGDDLDLDDDGALDVHPWKSTVDGLAIISQAEGVASEWTYAAKRVGPNGGLFIFHAKLCLDTQSWRIGSTGYSTNPQIETAGRLPPPCAAALCLGDIDQDATCGASDLAIILTHWGEIGTLGDIDSSGIVDSMDLALLLSRWGDCDL